jgi:hypothetical protein
MFSFPIAIALIPYGLTLIFFALLAVINVYHLVHYGATSGVSFVVTFMFLAGAAFILFFTWQAVGDTDWSQQIDVAPFGYLSSAQPL